MSTNVYALLSSLLVAIVTAIVTVRLSLGQFRSERWWERKADAYTLIIAALSDAIRYVDDQAERYLKGGSASDELKSRYDDAWHQLERARATGAFLISDNAMTMLERLASRETLDWKSSAPWDFFATESKAYVLALEEIRREAKRDLKVK